MTSPRVSVITPTRNRLRLLAQTLDSVAAQTLADWEHIVVDDGSDDGTARMMRARAAADPRVRYLVRDGERSGANVCRNLGLRAATAPLAVLLDSDDLLEPDCLERRVAVMDRNADLDFATFGAGVFVERVGDLDRRAGQDLIGDDLARFLYFELPWVITGPIWRLQALLRLGLFDESLPSWQDVELHVRAIAAGGRYLRFPEIDHHIRWQFEPTKTSVEQRRSPRHLTAALGVIERLEAHVRGGPGMNWVRQRALCSLYFFVAERWLERGDLTAALAAWRMIRARRLGPAHLHLAGAGLLALARSGAPAVTAIRKWKGLTRLRSEPELVRHLAVGDGAAADRRAIAAGAHAVDCVYVAACARDLRLARICIASIRYFYPEVPIHVLAGGALEPGFAREVKRFWNVDVAALPAGDYGLGFVKLEPLFGPPGRRFLVLDADTIFAGKVLHAHAGAAAPFVVDDEQLPEADLRRLYYDWDALREIDPQAQPAWRAFNTGQWFGVAGVLAREDFDPWIEWTLPRRLRHPGLLMCGDQGVLNYVLIKKAALEGLALERRRIMRWPGHSLAGLDVASVAAGAAPPLVIHWAGMKTMRLRDMAGAELLRFFEDFYYRRLPFGRTRRALAIGRGLWAQGCYEAGRRVMLRWRSWSKPPAPRAPRLGTAG